VKLRTKLTAILVFLVVSMATIFYLIAHSYFLSLFGQYVEIAEHGEAEQWARSLGFYYSTHHDSWSGVESYADALRTQSDLAHPHNYVEEVTIFAPDGRVLTSVGHRDVSGASRDHLDDDDGLSSGMRSDIVINGRLVGRVVVEDTGSDSLHDAQIRVLRSMDVATIGGGLTTTLMALFLGLLFASRLTRPLGVLMRGIERVGRGDVGVRVPALTKDELGRVAAQFNQMAERLEQTEAARRRLVADVAHELRTPLTVMEGQLELIQQGIVAPDEQTLLPILDEVMRLTRLVDDLHQLSLADGGVLPLHRQWTDMVALVRRIVDNFIFEAEERRVRLSFSTSAEHISAFVDAHRCTQIMVNLLGNAMRYTPAGGSIDVHLVRLSTTVRCTVTDDGPGIPADQLAHVFDRFYRGETSRSRETGGMGLGLSIAREFANAHGGTLTASNHSTRGAVFTLTLPLGDTEATTAHS
jgi:two-component system sensor histidine kinase BaeS